jgi:pimeloyl-ACP methyl ester carboxylesterase
MASAFHEGTIEANGITHAYLEAGEGPLVLLLHGFPDNAWTWEHQLYALAHAGYRAVAPFLRGYPPTDVPTESFDTEVVTEDLRALIEAFGDEAVVVGHDWGALATLSLAAIYPDSVKKIMSIGVGHPKTAVEIFKSPRQLHYSFHIWLFQLEGFAEFALRENDFALVEYLWRHWSSEPPDEEHIERVKKTLTEPGAVEAALAYYRGLVRIPSENPGFFERATQPISVPSLVVYGQDDPAQAISAGEAPFFTGPYRRELILGAGHFVHRERPEKFTALLLEWLKD